MNKTPEQRQTKDATEQDDTRDRLSIEHSEKRLKGRFYLFPNCSDKLGDRLTLQFETWKI